MTDNLRVEVFCEENYCFVCGAWGKCTTSILEEIEDEIAENFLPLPDGTYTFTAHYENAQRDHEGRIEIQAYWELDQIGYEPIPMPTDVATIRIFEPVEPTGDDDIPF